MGSGDERKWHANMHTYKAGKVSRLPWQPNCQSRVREWIRLDKALVLHICVRVRWQCMTLSTFKHEGWCRPLFPRWRSFLHIMFWRKGEFELREGQIWTSLKWGDRVLLPKQVKICRVHRLLLLQPQQFMHARRFSYLSNCRTAQVLAKQTTIAPQRSLHKQALKITDQKSVRWHRCLITPKYNLLTFDSF